jgi:hypothetical protein
MQQILVDFLANKTNNNKWLNYSQRKLFSKRERGSSSCLQPEDFVSYAREKILETVSITGAGTAHPGFRLIKEGKAITGDLENLHRYVYSLIYWSISNSCKVEQKTIYLSKNNDCSITIDPSNDDEKHLTKEFIEKCSIYLEKIDPIKKEVFEYKLDGVPNRVIAKILQIKIRDVENMLKSITRLLRSMSVRAF